MTKSSLQHTTVDVKKVQTEINIVTLQREETVQVFDNTQDNGYHSYGTQWWTNPECPYAFKYLNIDSMYPPVYFDNTIKDVGHPANDTAKNIYNYMQEMYLRVFGCQFESVLELGVGGGEITRQFHNHNIDYVAVEGTTAGCEKLVSNGIKSNCIIQSDLKVLPRLGRKFDIAMCTEVAEHIEPWFASKVVSNCIEHADVVWFSAAQGSSPPHYHHMNEVPISAWDNLFAYFGFNHYIALDGRFSRADRLYLNDQAYRQVK